MALFSVMTEVSWVVTVITDCCGLLLWVCLVLTELQALCSHFNVFSIEASLSLCCEQHGGGGDVDGVPGSLRESRVLGFGADLALLFVVSSVLSSFMMQSLWKLLVHMLFQVVQIAWCYSPDYSPPKKAKLWEQWVVSGQLNRAL